MPKQSGQQAAAGRLRELLLDPDLPYRLMWFKTSLKPGRANKLNAMAIARHLAESRDMWGGDTTAEQVKDTVARAVSAEPSKRLLSPGTLIKFIDGFDMDDEHSEELWALLSGADPRSTEPIVGDLIAPTLSQTPPRHSTVLLHEYHYVGADGLPERHRTIQIIRALVDGLDRYCYRFDTDHATVSVSRPGNGVTTSGKWVEHQLYGIDILLKRPLMRDETVSLQYDTVFSYNPAKPPPREFRRGATGRTENLEIYVQFHPNRLPRKLWWGQWDGYDNEAQLISRQPLALEDDLSRSRFLPYIERTVVGFGWDWE